MEHSSHQNRAAGGWLQAGQAAGQQRSVAALRVVLQTDAVRLGILHYQARIVRLRQAGVQFASTGIHEVRPRTGGGDCFEQTEKKEDNEAVTCETRAGYSYLNPPVLACKHQLRANS